MTYFVKKVKIPVGKPRKVLASQISNAATAFVTSAFGPQGVA